MGPRRTLLAPRGVEWVCTHYSMHAATWSAASGARPTRTSSPTVRSAVQAASSRVCRFSHPRRGRQHVGIVPAAASSSPSPSSPSPFRFGPFKSPSGTKSGSGQALALLQWADDENGEGCWMSYNTAVHGKTPVRECLPLQTSKYCYV
jgi:hypothetical protein